MGKINYSSKKDKIKLIARSDMSSSRSITTYSPISGDKQVVDFGTNIKQLNLLVYSEETINPGKVISVFNDDFQGKAVIQTTSLNKYSGTPYSYININAIGEDPKGSKEIKAQGPIHVLQGLEDHYMVNYQTTYLDRIGTGFSISLATKEKLATAGKVKFKYDGNTYILGTEKAILSGYGGNASRLNKSTTANFIDPLAISLQKAVIISTVSPKENEFLKIIPNKKALVYLEEYNLIRMINTLGQGGLQELIELFFEGDNVEIDFSNMKKSPIIQALMSSGVSKDIIAPQVKNLFQQNMTDTLVRDGLYTVGGLLAQLLPLLGLEFYHIKNNRYSLEPPRYLFFDDKYHNEIKENEVVSISQQKPITSLANVVLPNVDFQNLALRQVATKCSLYFASQLINKLGEIVKLPIIKIQTYNIPNLLIPEYAQFEKVPLVDRTNQYLRHIWIYYSSLAVQSIFSKLDTGSIELVFKPEITEPYKWYKVAGHWYFITNISHNISRGALGTHLSYSHKYDPKIIDFFKNILDNADHNKYCEDYIKKEFKKHGLETPLNAKEKPKQTSQKKITPYKARKIKSKDGK